ncbi:MAG: imidazole glycerol phosphate synthase subunit HisH [Acidobacteria bacterium]|nr:imidazole glycerol phosphate synthase subunit HisH [Acidobacteriota bacterium]MBK8316728.1 imidazole glycerol phosphate synthase subunit HisH [Acidobacteriota bacterium]MBK9707999.1 imidazole glycerol phosphate synthase subunit HisH [Acidobacteriota bacterium]
MSIAIIDYGVGNLRSVEKAFTSQGIDAVVTSDEQILRKADKLVLPGVGAFAACMDGLRKHNFDRLVIEAAQSGKPIIGLCVGLQMMFDEGHEFGIHKGLGLLPGKVVRFPDGIHVPHIGWNQVEFKQDHPIFRGLPENPFFYFVHSYYCVPDDPTCILGETDYGQTYASICGRDNIVGVQFHPEKSQGMGLQLLKNFAAM